MWTSFDRVHEVNNVSDNPNKPGINRCRGSTWVITILTLSIFWVWSRNVQDDVWGHKNCSATGRDDLEHFWPHSWSRGWLLSTGRCVSSHPFLYWLSVNKMINMLGNTTLLWLIVPLKCVFDGENIWTFYKIWDEKETRYWDFILYQKYSTCYNLL